MPEPLEHFNSHLIEMIDKATDHPIESKEATEALKNLKTFSECRPPEPTIDPDFTPEPTTVLGKVKVGVARVWDNETTRVFLKAGGAFAGVWYVAHTTIKKDHVLERQAYAQANQRPIT